MNGGKRQNSGRKFGPKKMVIKISVLPDTADKLKSGAISIKGTQGEFIDAVCKGIKLLRPEVIKTANEAKAFIGRLSMMGKASFLSNKAKK